MLRVMSVSVMGVKAKLHYATLLPATVAGHNVA